MPTKEGATIPLACALTGPTQHESGRQSPARTAHSGPDSNQSTWPHWLLWLKLVLLVKTFKAHYKSQEISSDRSFGWSKNVYKHIVYAKASGAESLQSIAYYLNEQSLPLYAV